MKMMLLRPSQPSGSMPHQRYTSQPADGGILSTLHSNFPELSQLFGTGMTGSRLTSGTPGSRECAEHSTRFPRAWSDPVSSLRKPGISGWLTPLSSILIWWTTKMEHFRSMDSSPIGHQVRIDVTILHSCMIGTRLDEKVMKLSMLMQNSQIPGFLEEPLIRCYPSPYWHPIPYSGKGRPLWKSDKGLLKSVSAYILYNKALVVLFTPYKLFSQSMLTFEYWSLDGVRLSEGRGQNNQQPTPNDNKKQVVVFLCGSGR